MKKKGFVFAIRIAKSFYVEDMLGAIIDEILYSEDSKFDAWMFPEVHEQQGVKLLFNRKTGNKFTINHSDFIFEYNVENDFEEEFHLFLKAFVDVIINRVFKKFKIQNISRFGFVIKSELQKNDDLLLQVSEIIKNSCDGLESNSLSLRYNIVKKKPLKLGKIVTKDFDNRIITYDRANSDSPLLFSVDYQKYYNPELQTIEDSIVTFEVFCNNSYKSFVTEYETK
jgi:hypothetical protein